MFLHPTHVHNESQFNTELQRISWHKNTIETANIASTCIPLEIENTGLSIYGDTRFDTFFIGHISLDATLVGNMPVRSPEPPRLDILAVKMPYDNKIIGVVLGHDDIYRETTDQTHKLYNFAAAKFTYEDEIHKLGAQIETFDTLSGDFATIVPDYAQNKPKGLLGHKKQDKPATFAIWEPVAKQIANSVAELDTYLRNQSK